jgi:hypothetical protein
VAGAAVYAQPATGECRPAQLTVQGSAPGASFRQAEPSSTQSTDGNASTEVEVPSRLITALE